MHHHYKHCQSPSHETSIMIDHDSPVKNVIISSTRTITKPSLTNIYHHSHQQYINSSADNHFTFMNIHQEPSIDHHICHHESTNLTVSITNPQHQLNHHQPRIAGSPRGPRGPEDRGAGQRRFGPRGTRPSGAGRGKPAPRALALE